MRFQQAQWLDSVDSTNAWLRREWDAGTYSGGEVVAARAQTAGRGQYGRAWVTTPGQDLAFSFLLREAQVDLAWIPSLPMTVALAVAEVLAHFGVPAQVKWPNDVLIRGQKICGILAENIPQEIGACVLVGVGININMAAEEAQRIDRPTTSLRMERGESTPPEVVLERLLPRLDAWLARWCAGGFAAIRSDWIASAAGLGNAAEVRQGENALTGVLADFGEYGELVLLRPSGERRMIWSGDLVLGGAG